MADQAVVEARLAMVEPAMGAGVVRVARKAEEEETAAKMAAETAVEETVDEVDTEEGMGVAGVEMVETVAGPMAVAARGNRCQCECQRYRGRRH